LLLQQLGAPAATACNAVLLLALPLVLALLLLVLMVVLVVLVCSGGRQQVSSLVCWLSCWRKVGQCLKLCGVFPLVTCLGEYTVSLHT
jgi:hypothetical protein